MGLSIMILLSVISSLLPNAASKETEPLIMLLYKTALSAFVFQMCTVLTTDSMRKWTIHPWRCKPIYREKARDNDQSHALKDVLDKMEEIRRLLDMVDSNLSAYWQRMARRVNLSVCATLFCVEIGVICYF